MPARYSFMAALGLACLASSAILRRATSVSGRRPAFEDEPLGLGA